MKHDSCVVCSDNLVEGKRHPRLQKRDSDLLQAVTVAESGASAGVCAGVSGELTRSGRKRKPGPVDASTPTPKVGRACKEKGKVYSMSNLLS